MRKNTETELKKLRRTELLELMLGLQLEVERLKEENKALKEKLEHTQNTIENAGSIAEAALKLNGVFEAAQRAADYYLESVWKKCKTIKKEDSRDN